MCIIIVDTETGGLDPATDAIIELGAVVWDGERLKGPENEFRAVLLDRRGRLDPAALAVNGYTEARVRAEGEGLWQGGDAFRKFCDQHVPEGKVTIGGHNAGFDFGFIRRLYTEVDEGFYFHSRFSHRTICTMNVLRFLRLTGHVPTGVESLKSAVEYFGIEKQEFHTALGDARMAADLLTELVRRFDAFKELP